MQDDRDTGTHRATPELTAAIQLVLAVFVAICAFLGPWAEHEDGTAGALSSDGGAGFGVVVCACAVVLVGLGVVRLVGRNHWFRWVGVEQMTLLASVAVLALTTAFIVGWLRVFPAGTGWAAVAVLFAAWFIPQVSLARLGKDRPERAVAPVPLSVRVPLTIAVVLGGALVALGPFASWIGSDGVSVSGYEGGAELADGATIASGPRSTYILAIVGVAAIAITLCRYRGSWTNDPGPHLLTPHVLLILGVVAVLIPVATAWGAAMTDGISLRIGLWSNLLGAIVIVAASLAELRLRDPIAK